MTVANVKKTLMVRKIFVLVVTIVSLVALMLLSAFAFSGCDNYVSLADYKNTKSEEIQTYADSLSLENDYSRTSQYYIVTIVSNAKTEIEKAKNKASIDKIVDNAKEDLDSIWGYNADLIISITRESPDAWKLLNSSFLDENRTFGIGYANKQWDPNDPNSEQALWDTTSPKYRTHIVLDKERLDEIFVEAPEVDFDKEMVIVVLFSTTDGKRNTFPRITLNGDTLYVDIKEGARETNNCAAPYPIQSISVIKLDLLDVVAVEARFV